jgi:hypothetical protein
MISTLNVSTPETASGRYFCRKILVSDLFLDSPRKSFNAILLVFVDCTVYFTVPYKARRQRGVMSAALQAVAMAGFVFLGVPFVDCGRIAEEMSRTSLNVQPGFPGEKEAVGWIAVMWSWRCWGSDHFGVPAFGVLEDGVFCGEQILDGVYGG